MSAGQGILKPILTIDQQAARDPHFRNALVAAILDKTPCAACGLVRFGHAADTVAAGNPAHSYQAATS